jgi:hypothetical protein
MPAFTFEKISPPSNRASAPAPASVPPVANKKQRGVLIQALDRLAEARVRRALKNGKADASGKPPAR